MPDRPTLATILADLRTHLSGDEVTEPIGYLETLELRLTALVVDRDTEIERRRQLALRTAVRALEDESEHAANDTARDALEYAANVVRGLAKPKVVTDAE